MPRGALAGRRLLCLTAGALLAALVAGCTTAPPAPTVSGTTLAIYLSAPAALASAPQAQDVIEAEKLAVSQLAGQVKGFTLRLRVLTANQISSNARTAIEDKTSVAYLGEVTPGSSIDSLGITNAEDVLQVSPTQAASVPTGDFESFSTYGRTYASLAPGQDPQAILREPAGKAFTRAFRSTYGHAPSAQAIFGYLATASVLKALQKADSAANNRGTVRDSFFALKNVSLSLGPAGPELGTVTVNRDGTMAIAPASGSPAP